MAKIICLGGDWAEFGTLRVFFSDSVKEVEMKINYIRPFDEGEITAEAIISSKGKRIALGEAAIEKDGGQLVAKCLATYMII